MEEKRKVNIKLNSPVIVLFVTICVMVMIIGTITRGSSTRALFSTYRSSPLSIFTYVRSVTYIFGHADWNHLIGNMTYILLVGPLLEEKYGSAALLEIIGITAVITAALNSLLFPGVGLCGASGIVFAFILLSSFTSFQEGELPLTFIMVMIFFLGQEIMDGLFQRDNISQMAHIVGGIVGGLVGYILNVKKKDTVEMERI